MRANKRLVETKYIDREKNIVDFGTGNVVGDNIFDKYTHSSFYDDLLKNPEYMSDHYNLKGEVIMMSPNEYYKECAEKIFDTTPKELMRQREIDEYSLQEIKDLILKYKRQVFLPYINYAEKQQEGLHRMYVAGELFGWNHKFPVLAINWVDEEKHKQMEHDRYIRRLQQKISDAFNRAARYEFSSYDEFKEELQYTLDSAFEYDDDIEKPVKFDFEIDEDDAIVTVDEAQEVFNAKSIKIIEDDEKEENDEYSDLDDIPDEILLNDDSFDDFINKLLK